MSVHVWKYIHLTLGVFFVALGVVGAFLPVLPTTVFLIIAAFFFTKGSPRLRQKLLDHGTFGPAIIAWEETGAIPRRAKRAAIGMMAVTFAVCLFFLPMFVLVIQALLMGLGGAYVLTRPDA